MATRIEQRTITEPTAAQVQTVTVRCDRAGAPAQIIVAYQRLVDGAVEQRSHELRVDTLPVGQQTALTALVNAMVRAAATREGF